MPHGPVLMGPTLAATHVTGSASLATQWAQQVHQPCSAATGTDGERLQEDVFQVCRGSSAAILSLRHYVVQGQTMLWASDAWCAVDEACDVLQYAKTIERK